MFPPQQSVKNRNRNCCQRKMIAAINKLKNVKKVLSSSHASQMNVVVIEKCNGISSTTILWRMTIWSLNSRKYRHRVSLIFSRVMHYTIISIHISKLFCCWHDDFHSETFPTFPSNFSNIPAIYIVVSLRCQTICTCDHLVNWIHCFFPIRWNPIDGKYQMSIWMKV